MLTYLETISPSRDHCHQIARIGRLGTTLGLWRLRESHVDIAIKMPAVIVWLKHAPQNDANRNAMRHVLASALRIITMACYIVVELSAAKLMLD